MNNDTCTIGHCERRATRKVTISRGGTLLEKRPICKAAACKTIALQTASEFDTAIEALR